MSGQISVKPINDGQMLVNCPAHGMHIISRGEWSEEVLLMKRNPCRDCRAEKSASGEHAPGGGGPDTYARKHAGWRMLELGRRILHREVLERARAEEFMSHVAARDWHPIYFPNRMEANYYRLLLWSWSLGRIEAFVYQPEPIEFGGGVVAYRPDFQVIHSAAAEPQLVEIKGRMDARSVRKLRLLAEHRPELPMRIVTYPKTERAYAPRFPGYWEWVSWLELRARWGAICPGWER